MQFIRIANATIGAAPMRASRETATRTGEGLTGNHIVGTM
ncbi:hypothetical protein FTUN_7332 [Frigoriglobus tundricola]|uniref:Uncharacterized protein n=1 Tax=Frigoriglobus tundricola TaxID=2774151 RepID=A0A6M5Z073_9BACT|nr:hypothetical protein FTUN_7332 [Frigoriglobus tundricola]